MSRIRFVYKDLKKIFIICIVVKRNRRKMIQNRTENSTEWNPPESPLDCFTLTHIGVYLTILFCIALIVNGILLYVLIRFYKDLLYRNILMFSMIILNLFATIVEIPIAIAAFKCQ